MTKAKTPAAKRAPKTEQADPFAITKAGLYGNMPADRYNLDPCPQPSASAHYLAAIAATSVSHARYNHPRLNPDYRSDEATAGMDFGTVAHALLLNAGRYSVVDMNSWRSDAAKEKAREVRSLGATPILRKDFERCRAMTDKLIADLKLQPDDARDVLPNFLDDRFGGISEVVAAWRDNGVWLRARADRWIKPAKMKFAPHGLIVDYKTTGELAAPDTWKRKLYSFAADFQSVLYPEGFVAAQVQGGTSAEFKLPRLVMVVQEDEAPWEWSTFELSDVAKEHTRGKIANALAQHVTAMKTGVWPGYSRRINYVDPPAWEVNAEAHRQVAAQVMNSGVG